VAEMGSDGRDAVRRLVGVMMIPVDNSTRQLDRDFERAVFQSIVA